VAATSKSIDYNVAMTFILNNNNIIADSSVWTVIRLTTDLLLPFLEALLTAG